MFRVVEQLILFQGGVLLLGTALLINGHISLKERSKNSHSKIVVYGTFLILYFLYLFINAFWGLPGNLTESISIQNAIRINNDLSIYPSSQNFPYNGSLFGPILPLALSLIFALSENYILVSKIFVLILNIATVLLLYKMKDRVTNEILIFALAFYIYMTYVRPDILIVFLIVAQIYLLTSKFNKGFLFSFFFSLLILLKISAFFYAAILFVIFYPKEIKKLLKTLLFTLIQIFVFFLIFDISFGNWAKTNLDATRHQINVNNLLFNLFILIVVLSFVLAKDNRMKIQKIFGAIDILILVLSHLILLLIASKNGAGYNHLIPLLLIYSLTFQVLGIKFIKSNNISILIIAVMVVLIFSFRSNFNVITQGSVLNQDKIAEIKYFDRKYKGIFMGQSGIHGDDLGYVNYLSHGDIVQVDYSTFADFNLTGKKSTELNESIEACKFKYVVVPNLGTPFSMQSPYIYESRLFPGLDAIFKQSYSAIDLGRFFTIYSCRL